MTVRVIGVDVSFFSLKTLRHRSGGFSPASLSRLSVIRKTFDSRRNTKVSSKATPCASSLYMRHADSLLALNAFFVFVVEASFRERSKNVREKKLAPPPRPGTRRLIQSTGRRAPPTEVAFFGPKPPRRLGRSVSALHPPQIVHARGRRRRRLETDSLASATETRALASPPPQKIAARAEPVPGARLAKKNHGTLS